MKTLYLLRHAKSSWKFEELSDHDRPLSKRGRKDAALIGQEMLERKVDIDLIVSSSAVRAITTATLIAKELDYDPEKVGVQEELYHTSTEEILLFIRSMPEEYENIMLVGHNPTFTDLVNHLIPEKSIANLPTAGIVAISFDVSYWGEIEKENAKLLFFDFPKNYR